MRARPQPRGGGRRGLEVAGALAVAALLGLATVAVAVHSSGSGHQPLVAADRGQPGTVDTGLSAGTTPPATGVAPAPSAAAVTPATPLRPLTPGLTPAPTIAPLGAPRPASGANAAPVIASPPSRTTTAAASFQVTTLADLHFASASLGWVSGQQDDQAFIVATRDGGATWATQCIPVASGTISRVVSIDTSHVWALGSDFSRGTGLALRSTDGGAHWTAGTVPSGVATLFSGAFVDADNGWAVGYFPGGNNGAGGAIVHTVDGGRTWATQAVPQQAVAALYDVSFADALHGWAVGATPDHNGVMLATSDGGATWVPQPLGGGASELRGVQFVSRSQGWAVGWSLAGGAPSVGVILATSDGGATWTPQAHDADTTLWSVRFLDASRGWAVGQKQGGLGEVLRTNDGGATWQRQDAPASTVLQEVSFADASEGWAGGQQVVALRSHDGGASWQAVQVVASQGPC